MSLKAEMLFQMTPPCAFLIISWKILVTNGSQSICFTIDGTFEEDADNAASLLPLNSNVNLAPENWEVFKSYIWAKANRKALGGWLK